MPIVIGSYISVLFSDKCGRQMRKKRAIEDARKFVHGVKSPDDDIDFNSTLGVKCHPAEIKVLNMQLMQLSTYS